MNIESPFLHEYVLSPEYTAIVREAQADPKYIALEKQKTDILANPNNWRMIGFKRDTLRVQAVRKIGELSKKQKDIIDKYLKAAGYFTEKGTAEITKEKAKSSAKSPIVPLAVGAAALYFMSK